MFSEKVARYYFKQMINALDHCHSQGYAHRDMKPENLLLDDHFNLVLADFGFATLLSGKDGSGKLRSILGTESYMAPEIHSKAPYVGTAVDLFAAGIILFIFITGHPPFNQAKATDAYYNLICMNNHAKFWAAHSRRKPGGKDFFSKEFISLINCMLAFDPTQRPSLSEIKAHPWYNAETATPDEILAEFTKRNAKVQKLLERQRLILEKKKRLMEAKKKNKGANQVAFEGVNVWRSTQIAGVSADHLDSKSQGAREQVLKEIENLKTPELKREEKGTHTICGNGYHYSCMEPLELYKVAVCAAFNKTEQVEADHDNLAITLRIMTNEGRIGIKLAVISNEIGNAITFLRTEGSSIEYYKELKKITKTLEDIENRIMDIVDNMKEDEETKTE